MIDLCGGCGSDGVSISIDCADSFARIGVSKLHWECWSECNLHCGFCYRTEEVPLGREGGMELLDICRSSGAKTIVFAGGDPSLREDLPQLIDHAHTVGLAVELQSNFQVFKNEIKERISNGRVALSGVSMDASTPLAHDLFRSTKGNFKAVLAALDFHEEVGSPVIVRTMVSSQNYTEVSAIAKILSPYNVIRRWSLLEFTPVGRGFANKGDYELRRREFDLAARVALDSYTGPGEVDIYRAENKSGTYGLITAAGNLYGFSGKTEGGQHLTVGSMVFDHLSVLASRLPFSREQHGARYGA